MARLRKQRRAGRYRYQVNRKRLDKSIRGHGKIKCPEIAKAWNVRLPMGKNLKEMGLAADSNKLFSIPSAKEQRVKMLKMVNNFKVEDIIQDSTKSIKGIADELTPSTTTTTITDNSTIIENPPNRIIDQLEADAKAPRVSKFRLPKGVCAQISYLLDKYQLNYREMVKDKKNYDQETWKQFRAKVRKFMNIPQHFNKYLQARNLNGDHLNWIECPSDNDNE